MGARRFWSAYDDGRLSSMWVDLTLKLEDICAVLDRVRAGFYPRIAQAVGFTIGALHGASGGGS